MSNAIYHRKVIGMFDCSKRRLCKTKSNGSRTSLPSDREVTKFRLILGYLALLQLVNQILYINTRIVGSTIKLDEGKMKLEFI